MSKDFSKFIGKDKIVVELPERTEAKSGGFQIASGHDQRLVLVRCVIGNQDVPSGAEVLVPGLAVPEGQQTKLPDDKAVFVLGMDKVVAWLPLQKVSFVCHRCDKAGDKGYHQIYIEGKGSVFFCSNECRNKTIELDPSGEFGNLKVGLTD